jgi:Ni/Co efflux regulator RcnB
VPTGIGTIPHGEVGDVSVSIAIDHNLERGLMRRFLIIAAAFSLMLPALALAQGQGDQHHGGQGRGAPHRPAPHRAMPHRGTPHRGTPHRAMPHRAMPHRAMPHRAMPHRAMPHRPMPHRAMPRRAMPHTGMTHRGMPGHRPELGHGMNMRPGRFDHGRFSYRGRYHSRIYGRPFSYPHGWGYRRWRVGALFPLLFLAPTYYFTNYGAFGLEPPPPGFAWVRYGPDLVLVNVETRQVVNVIYGVFY